MESIPPARDAVNPAARAREIAELEPNLDVKDRLYQFAAELEAKFGRQADQFQAALGYTDLDLRDAIDTLRDAVAARLDTSDERQQTMLQFLEELQEQVRGLQARPPCMHPDDQLEAGGSCRTG